MDQDEHVVPSGQHYSGRNRIPNIQQFMEQLDKEKKQRDADIDAKLQRNKEHGEDEEHQPTHEKAQKDARWVRDPVTGKDVQIRDTKLDFKDAVENPQVSSDTFFFFSFSNKCTSFFYCRCLFLTKISANPPPFPCLRSKKEKSTAKQWTSLPLLIRYRKAPLLMFLFVAKRPPSYSTRRPRSATSPCSPA